MPNYYGYRTQRPKARNNNAAINEKLMGSQREQRRRKTTDPAQSLNNGDEDEVAQKKRKGSIHQAEKPEAEAWNECRLVAVLRTRCKEKEKYTNRKQVWVHEYRRKGPTETCDRTSRGRTETCNRKSNTRNEVHYIGGQRDR